MQLLSVAHVLPRATCICATHRVLTLSQLAETTPTNGAPGLLGIIKNASPFPDSMLAATYITQSDFNVSDQEWLLVL